MSSFGPMAKTRTRLADAAAGSANATAATATPAPSQRADLLRKLAGVFGEAAGGVVRDRDRDLAPRDLEVRVVVHLLRGGREAVHEVDRTLEVPAVEGLRDRAAAPRPAVDPLQPALDLLVTQKWHGSPRANRFARPL